MTRHWSFSPSGLRWFHEVSNMLCLTYFPYLQVLYCINSFLWHCVSSQVEEMLWDKRNRSIFKHHEPLLGLAVVDGNPILLRPNPPKPHWPSRPHHPIPPGTDLGLYNEGFVEGDIVPHPTAKNAVKDDNLLWPTGAIVYRPEDGVGCPDSPQCEILMKAMDHYHQRSCVRFKEWTGERDYVTIFFNPDSGACWSPVGRTGGEQLLSLGQRCWYMGIVVHELGHAVGFWHEMNRPDRDTYIHIYWDNILPGFKSAFAMHEPGTVDTLREPFDYRSIMMYDEYAFSKDGVSPTLQARQEGVTIGPIWKKGGLSSSDLRRIQKLYNCQGHQAKKGFPYDITCTFDRHTCGFKNGGSAVWAWKNNTKSENYVYTTCEESGSTPGYFLSVNLHPSSHSKRGCVRFWYLLRSEHDLVLQLSQIPLNSVTQQTYNPDGIRDLWATQESLGKWLHADVTIDTSHPFKLIFISAFSSMCRRGIIALDDVQIQYRPCPYSGVTKFSDAPPTSTARESMSDTPSTTESTTSATTATTISTGEEEEEVEEEEEEAPTTPHDVNVELELEINPLPPRPAIVQPRPPPPNAPDAITLPVTTDAPERDFDLPQHPSTPPGDDLPTISGNDI